MSTLFSKFLGKFEFSYSSESIYQVCILDENARHLKLWVHVSARIFSLVNSKTLLLFQSFVPIWGQRIRPQGRKIRSNGGGRNLQDTNGKYTKGRKKNLREDFSPILRGENRRDMTSPFFVVDKWFTLNYANFPSSSISNSTLDWIGFFTSMQICRKDQVWNGHNFRSEVMTVLSLIRLAMNQTGIISQTLFVSLRRTSVKLCFRTETSLSFQVFLDQIRHLISWHFLLKAKIVSEKVFLSIDNEI